MNQTIAIDFTGPRQFLWSNLLETNLARLRQTMQARYFRLTFDAEGAYLLDGHSQRVALDILPERSNILILTDGILSADEQKALSHAMQIWYWSHLISIMPLMSILRWRHTTLSEPGGEIKTMADNNADLEVTVPWWRLPDHALCPTTSLARSLDFAWFLPLFELSGPSQKRCAFIIDKDREEVSTSKSERTARELISRFRTIGFDPEFDLAVLCSLAPKLTLDTARLIWGEFLGEIDHEAIAVFFLSGLLKRAEEGKEEFVFKEGVAEILRRSVRYDELNRLARLFAAPPTKIACRHARQ